MNRNHTEAKSTKSEQSMRDLSLRTNIVFHFTPGSGHTQSDARCIHPASLPLEHETT